MEVAVLVSGVADPKWPLPPVLSLAALQAHAMQHAALSPFDEAALELALALRDADPGVGITALVAGDETLTRRVAGWRPDAIHRLAFEAVPRWDGAAMRQALAQALRDLAPRASIVLAGREFGDFDDGSLPAGLAQAIGMPYIPLVLRWDPPGDPLWARRQSPGGLERVQLPVRVLLSATNDPANRLRHPLMKNVMQARKALLGLWRAPPPAAAGALRLESLGATEAPLRRADCEWLAGTAQDKAEALAQLLHAAVR
jgi:electron transfer flavoprotein beta subunit